MNESSRLAFAQISRQWCRSEQRLYHANCHLSLLLLFCLIISAFLAHTTSLLHNKLLCSQPIKKLKLKSVDGLDVQIEPIISSFYVLICSAFFFIAQKETFYQSRAFCFFHEITGSLGYFSQCETGMVLSQNQKAQNFEVIFKWAFSYLSKERHF